MIVASSGWPDLELLEAAPILVWRSGLDGLCNWFNASWLAYTGRTMAQELGNGWTEGLHAEDFDRCLEAYLDAFGRHEPFQMEYRIMRACGQYGWIVDYGIPIIDRDGNFLGYVGYCFDITARHEAEEKRDHLCHDLEQSNADLEQFAYAASHDLREPLRKVAGFAALLGKSCASKLNDEEREFLHFVLDGAKRMDEMICDLLAFSRVERCGAPLEPMALGEALDYALFNLSQTIEEKKAAIEIGFDRTLAVKGDPHQIARLFQNLIGNAIKYCAKDVTPRIHLDALLVPEGSVTLTVTDNGIGIPPDSAEHVFQLFRRLHTHDEYEGTGVGLSICRRIVERHGGTIWVTPAEGGGSVFHVTLPR
ncbi:sensor histidine kinase [Magnetospirillum fulvum]|uniref:histidine kinase n=1 Tax=Magnetospirillum fulvum MGU-K5 TaxID=1316936 RepID=S9S8E9_MAGFU|nr:PAS domain-containing sensor histidine kinase [Magnetospirillum fulvum]EPY02152.1 Multi-sensor signal transduction histidine kinase [Magnetospirillum fulvum MGU-K5]